MNAEKLLKQKGIDPNKQVLRINRRETLEKFLEFIKEWELRIKVKKISKEDWEILFNSYADAIVDYHPDNDHQERAVFLKNEKILKKYGLTSEDIQRLDFC